MHRFRTASLVAGLAAALMGSLAIAGTAPSAIAGTNGQQLQLNLPPGLAWVTINGTNQKGASASKTFNHPPTTLKVTGWWWVGEVSVVGSGQANPDTPQHLYRGFCYVPQNQANSDWSVCIPSQTQVAPSPSRVPPPSPAPPTPPAPHSLLNSTFVANNSETSTITGNVIWYGTRLRLGGGFTSGHTLKLCFAAEAANHKKLSSACRSERHWGFTLTAHPAEQIQYLVIASFERDRVHGSWRWVPTLLGTVMLTRP